MKHFLDFWAAAIILVLSAPVFAIIFFLVRINLGNPVIFKQKRPGLKGKPFTLYKFRSMTDETDEDGKLLPDALRFTRLSFLLRASSMDELPELFNVLKGDMSLVGPRPLLVQYLKRYNKEQARRHDVKPGITGWAQINGRNSLTWEDKFKLDLWYVDHHNLWLDIKILFLTVIQVIKGKDIHQEGHVTAEEFMGNTEDEKAI